MGTSQGTATAQVVEPIRTVPLENLSFGAISVAQGRAGEVRVNSDGATVTYVDGAKPQCGARANCSTHPGSFSVFGAAHQAYDVSLPSQVTAYGRRTGRGLVVGDLEMRSSNNPALHHGGRLDGDGRDTFFVGGILSVPAGIEADVFTAELPVTVSYN
ncbi:DUF4402 domain-containing protein [Qipengyuania sp. NPDC077563]|uniref:DUF4402 domain-containing protein n=1 Tax=Qipengyuania sp. NPDC077563 TaxID=3364497 RepID=UPI00384D22F9